MMMDSRHQGSIFILGSVLGRGAEVKRSGRARGRPEAGLVWPVFPFKLWKWRRPASGSKEMISIIGPNYFSAETYY